MEVYFINGEFVIVGEIVSDIKQHDFYKDFKVIDVKVLIAEGVYDIIPISMPNEMQYGSLKKGERIKFVSNVQAYNEFINNANKLTLVFKCNLYYETTQKFRNQVTISGSICTNPKLIDSNRYNFVLRSQRNCSKSDYIPCDITYKNSNAYLKQNDNISLIGEIRQRNNCHFIEIGNVRKEA